MNRQTPYLGRLLLLSKRKYVKLLLETKRSKS